jgi:hypothetical protein
VLNAFFVMGTVVCIFSVAAFDLFSEKVGKAGQGWV